MNREIRDQWTAALRSGDYFQGRAALHTNINGHVQHCCLGVLCELALKAGVVERTSRYGDEGYGWADSSGIAVENSILPDEVRDWAGLKSRAGVLPVRVVDANGRGRDDLTELNDVAGYTFEQIADVIEEQF